MEAIFNFAIAYPETKFMEKFNVVGKEVHYWVFFCKVSPPSAAQMPQTLTISVTSYRNLQFRIKPCNVKAIVWAAHVDGERLAERSMPLTEWNYNNFNVNLRLNMTRKTHARVTVVFLYNIALTREVMMYAKYSHTIPNSNQVFINQHSSTANGKGVYYVADSQYMPILRPHGPTRARAYQDSHHFSTAPNPNYPGSGEVTNIATGPNFGHDGNVLNSQFNAFNETADANTYNHILDEHEYSVPWPNLFSPDLKDGSNDYTMNQGHSSLSHSAVTTGQLVSQPINNENRLNLKRKASSTVSQAMQDSNEDVGHAGSFSSNYQQGLQNLGQSTESHLFGGDHVTPNWRETRPDEFYGSNASEVNRVGSFVHQEQQDLSFEQRGNHSTFNELDGIQLASKPQLIYPNSFNNGHNHGFYESNSSLVDQFHNFSGRTSSVIDSNSPEIGQNTMVANQNPTVFDGNPMTVRGNSSVLIETRWRLKKNRQYLIKTR